MKVRQIKHNLYRRYIYGFRMGYPGKMEIWIAHYDLSLYYQMVKQVGKR